MTRPTLVLLALAALAGCTTTTHVVDRTDAAAVVRLDAAVRGRRGEIALASGERVPGFVRFVRVDSTAWAGVAARTVPTADVSSLVMRTGQGAVRRGALIGAGAGLAFAVASAFFPDEFGETAGAEFAFYVGLATVPVGAAFGAVGGAGEPRRVEYRLVDGPR